MPDMYAGSNKPEQFGNPDLVWLPLTTAQMAVLRGGEVLRVEIPGDPEEGTAPTVVMIRPPRT